MTIRTISAALGAATALAFLTPAHATTFANYSAAPGGATNISFSGNAGGGSLTGSGETVFSFLTGTATALTNLSATFSLNATSTNAGSEIGGSQAYQPGLDGSFSFIYDGPTTASIANGANLLSGSFTGASIIGAEGGSTGSVQGSIISGGTITFTSDEETFSSTGDKGLSLSLTSVMPTLHTAAGGGMASFTGVSTGSFSSVLPGAVPEPAAWAMMLVGFFGVGAALRSKPTARSVAIA